MEKRSSSNADRHHMKKGRSYERNLQSYQEHFERVDFYHVNWEHNKPRELNENKQEISSQNVLWTSVICTGANDRRPEDILRDPASEI